MIMVHVQDDEGNIYFATGTTLDDAINTIIAMAESKGNDLNEPAPAMSSQQTAEMDDLMLFISRLPDDCKESFHLLDVL